VGLLNSDAANMPVNVGRLRQLHLLHRAYRALYNESSLGLLQWSARMADVSTALFAVLCNSLTLTFM